jgi:CRISPR-associated protein Csd1
MILQALKEYYDRKATDPDSGIAPLGWEKKEIPFLVVIDKRGNFLRFNDTRERKGKNLRAKSFIVPSLGESKGSGIKANLLWENAEYMFGFPMKDDSRPDRVQRQHEAFKAKIAAIPQIAEAKIILQAICTFFDNFDANQIQSDPLWPEIKKLNQSLLLAIESEVITDLPVIHVAIEQSRISAGGPNKTLCLVSGNQDIMTPLELPIKGVQGAKSTGAHLVSINNKVTQSGNGGETPAFSSFMKEQGANSPIGKTASLAYATALNTLLDKDSKQKIRVGDATAVFWSAKRDSFEDTFGDFFEDPPKDDPDRLTNAVLALYQSVETGTAVFDSDDTRFYVLGLSPNAARISVRFWHVGTVSEFAIRFRKYFEDLEIAHGQKDKDHLSLWRLLVSTAAQGKTENITPNLAGNVMRSILEGLPFPETLLQAVILRVKAEREVTYSRAKLIKGCLNRKLRATTTDPEKFDERRLKVKLDKENTDIGYCLGRLFATLEKIQQEANPGINATIRDKFYASMSSAPRTAFGNLMRLKNHHLSKLEKVGRKIYFENLLVEIIGKFPTELPAYLDLNEQGKFAIGYYHQIQDFFTKKSDGKAMDVSSKTNNQ